MKKVKDSIRTKELITVLIIVLLFFLFRSALSYVFTRAGEAREEEMLALKMDTMLNVVDDVNARRMAADEGITANRRAGVRMMTGLLREFVTADGYDGPRTFSDGFVAEFRDGHVILPQEYGWLADRLRRAQIEESAEKGTMLRCTAADGEDLASERCYLFFGKIAQDLFYADILPESRYNDYMERSTRSVSEALETSDNAFGALTLVLREQDGETELLRHYGSEAVYEALSSSGLLPELVRGETSAVTLNGKEYSCARTGFNTDESGESPLLFVQLIPKDSLREESDTRVLLLGFVMVIILASVTIYTIAAQRAMAEQELDEELKARYSPRRLRRRLLNTGAVSVVLIFAIVVLVEAVGLMYTELRNGRDVLDLFSRQLQRSTEEEYRQIQREEEMWIVSRGEKLAALLTEYPALNTRQKLRETCEALDVETITLFDTGGRQLLCSGAYPGARLYDAQYPALYDFRRLLYGEKSIVHEAALDPITGLERQQIGVAMPASDEDGLHGVLLMTLLPERTARTARAIEAGDVRLFNSASGTICFAADAASGEIVYAGDPDMIGKRIREYGVPEDSLRDGFMDFAEIAGTGCLMMTSRVGDRVSYYAAETSAVFGRIVKTGVVVALIFAAALVLLQTILLRGYSEENYKEWEQLRAEERERLRQHIKKLDGEAEREAKKKSILNKLLDLIDWDHKSAGAKAGVILRVGLLILIPCVLAILTGKLLPNERCGTMFGFFMGGGWKRGLNLFSLCAIMLLAGIAYLVNVLCSLLLKLIGGIVSERGETVLRLLYSCVRYVTVIGGLYFALEYLGFSAGTIVASLGIVSLAISLGAQDLIKDILAGLAIVFDGSFHIGDVVQIGDKEGVVREIGVRATTLTVDGNNTLYVNNSEISSVLNKSKELSALDIKLRVPASESLLRLEELLERELPKIGAGNGKIMEGPYLLGVTSLSGDLRKSVMTLTIEAMINQKDEDEVTSYLYRELRLLFEREDIELL